MNSNSQKQFLENPHNTKQKKNPEKCVDTLNIPDAFILAGVRPITVQELDPLWNLLKKLPFRG